MTDLGTHRLVMTGGGSKSEAARGLLLGNPCAPGSLLHNYYIGKWCFFCATVWAYWNSILTHHSPFPAAGVNLNFSSSTVRLH